MHWHTGTHAVQNGMTTNMNIKVVIVLIINNHLPQTTRGNGPRVTAFFVFSCQCPSCAIKKKKKRYSNRGL